MTDAMTEVQIHAVRATAHDHDEAGDKEDPRVLDTPEADAVTIALKIKASAFASGNFSKVFEAELLRPEHCHVAVKRCQVLPHVKSREVSVLRSLDHVNIIKLFYFYWTGEGHQKQLSLVLEYLPKTLYQTRKYLNNPLSFRQISSFSHQLFSAVSHMHSKRICHRDIKPQNILVDGEVLKLADFGSAKVIPAEDKHGSVPYIVSRHYRAPELLLQNKRYSLPIDIWSCGCVLGELIQRAVLFPGNDQTEQLRLIVYMLGSPTFADMEVLRPGYSRLWFKNRGVTPNANDTLGPMPPRSWHDKFTTRGDLDDSAVELLNRCLVFDPSKRITATEAAQHSFHNLHTRHTHTVSRQPTPQGHTTLPVLHGTQRTHA